MNFDIMCIRKRGLEVQSPLSVLPQHLSVCNLKLFHSRANKAGDGIEKIHNKIKIYNKNYVFEFILFLKT